MCYYAVLTTPFECMNLGTVINRRRPICKQWCNSGTNLPSEIIIFSMLPAKNYRKQISKIQKKLIKVNRWSH